MNITTTATVTVLLAVCYGAYCLGYVVGYVAANDEVETGVDSRTEPVLIALARRLKL